MRTRLNPLLAAAIVATSTILATAQVGAKSLSAPSPQPAADTYDSSYRSDYGHANYTTRCRIIDRHYYQSGCYRYCRITYLHERVDCHGHVISCWRSSRTVRC